MRVRSRRDFLGSAARLSGGAAATLLTPFTGRAEVRVDSNAGRMAGGDSLKAHAAARGLLYGCAVNEHWLAADPDYAALLIEQCGIVVAENAMKWGALRPGPEEFRFARADALMTFAEANGMKVRGHNLAWHRDNPRWFDVGLTATNARQMLVAHIHTVMGRYAGRMHSWDVVNEAIEVADGRPDGLRKSAWLRLAGEDFIELAFRTAREADPKALLTYNEYGIEGESAVAEQKRAAVLRLLRRMRAHGVPIDAIGVQSHLSAGGAGAMYGLGLTRFLAAVRELGLQVFVTEMDVNDRALGADVPLRDIAVAAAYEEYLDLVLGDASVRAVLTWGITDKYTWLNSDDPRTDGQGERPLLFDAAYKPKAAFFAARGAFDGRRAGKGRAGEQP